MVPDPGKARLLIPGPHFDTSLSSPPTIRDSYDGAHLTPPPADKSRHSPSRPTSFTSEYGHDADDERSSQSSPFSHWSGTIMGPVSDEHLPDPSYPGEDTRPTSQRELLGFYAYSFAAEVFVVCGLGAFIPITLEELARASPTAVLAHDHSIPCKAHGIERRSALGTANSFVFPRAGHESREGAQCVFRILGTEINTASFALYTFSMSVLLQALLVVTMSGAADHGRYRKSLMVAFAVIGAVATMLFLPVTPGVYLLGSLWAIIGNVCFGASFVLLNSFLPLLVRWHSSVRPTWSERGSEDNWQAGQEVSTSGFCLRTVRELSMPNVCIDYSTLRSGITSVGGIAAVSVATRFLQTQIRRCISLTERP